MNALILLIIIACSTSQKMAVKAYYKRTNSQGTFTLTTLFTIAASLFFVIAAGGKLYFDPALIPWAAVLAISYGASTLFNFLAISCGSLTLTSLVLAYSMVLPTLFGIVFLDEPISPWLFLGITLLLISLLLINYKPDKIKITVRWAIYVGISFFCNACSTITQKMQQVEFDGAYKSEFMILGLVMMGLFLCILVFIYERKHLAFCLKKGGMFGLTYGVFNGAVNMLVMILSALMPISVMFPSISAGNIIATTAVSYFIYKERLSRNQILGVILGICAIISLSF